MSSLTISFQHYIGTHSLCSKTRQKKKIKEIRKREVRGREGRRRQRDEEKAGGGSLERMNGCLCMT